MNSLCARSNATKAADSSCVGGRGGGGAGVDLTARTAASLCVFLTLGAVVALGAVALGALAFEAPLRANDFGVAFFALAGALDFAAIFFAARAFTGFRAEAFAVTARLAFGFDGDLALTARFVVFADAVLTFERDVDRLKPFVRLLLMGGISKGCSPWVSSRGNRRELTIEAPLNQRAQLFKGALTLWLWSTNSTKV